MTMPKFGRGKMGFGADDLPPPVEMTDAEIRQANQKRAEGEYRMKIGDLRRRVDALKARRDRIAEHQKKMRMV